MNNNIITIGTALKWRGIYDSEKTYYQDNIVLDAGCLFRCKVLQIKGCQPTLTSADNGRFQLINPNVWDVMLDMTPYYNKIVDTEHFASETLENFDRLQEIVSKAENVAELTDSIRGLLPVFNGSVINAASVINMAEGIYYITSERRFVNHMGDTVFFNSEHYNGTNGKARKDKVFLRIDGTLHHYDNGLIQIADMNAINGLMEDLAPYDVESESEMQELIESGVATIGRIYYTPSDKIFIWNGNSLITLSENIKIGETANTAFDGSKGYLLTAKVNTLENNVALHTTAISGLERSVSNLGIVIDTKADKTSVASIEHDASLALQTATVAAQSVSAALTAANDAKNTATAITDRISTLESKSVFEELASEEEWQARKTAGTLQTNVLYYVPET